MRAQGVAALKALNPAAFANVTGEKPLLLIKTNADKYRYVPAHSWIDT
jgi:hypothetical protein